MKIGNVRDCVVTGTMCALFLALLGVGCVSEKVPYDHFDNWAMRQNAVPQYFAKYDVIYLPPVLYDGFACDRPDAPLLNWSKRENAQRVHSFVKAQTVDIFGNRVRVFSPFVHAVNPPFAEKILAEEDADSDLSGTLFDSMINETCDAIVYYLEHFHDPERPYVLMAQGQGARAMYEALRKCDDVTMESGFVAAYLAGVSNKTPQMVRTDFKSREFLPASEVSIEESGVIKFYPIEDETQTNTFCQADFTEIRNRVTHALYKARWKKKLPREEEDPSRNRPWWSF